MSRKVLDHMLAKANVHSETRVDDSYEARTISADEQLVYTDQKYLLIDSDTAGSDVILPVANDGNLKVGWTQRIKIDAATAESVKVMTYDAVTPVELKAPLAGQTFDFVCVGVGTAAGSWVIYRVNEDGQQEAERYVGVFNATTDWTLNGEVYERTVTAATHGITGNNPAPHTFEGTGPFERAEVGENLAANGDYTITVSASPDNRFAGKTIIM